MSESLAVNIKALTRTYTMGSAKVHALRGIDWQVPHGDFWAIMGPSGSGKSTLLNMIGCLDRPDTGTYHLDNQEVGSLNDDELSDLRLRSLGFIFQSFNLIAQLTVRENIELPLFYLGWTPARSAERADELAESVGLRDRLDHRPNELSGGQRQRVAIARALANDPAVLLADEPTGNLDSKTTEQIMELLDQLHQKGKTIIIVTHESEIAERAAHRLHMRDGVIDRTEHNS